MNGDRLLRGLISERLLQDSGVARRYWDGDYSGTYKAPSYQSSFSVASVLEKMKWPGRM